MTDPTTPPVPANSGAAPGTTPPVGSPPPVGDQKSPLDVLEEILKDTKGKGGSGDPAADKAAAEAQIAADAAKVEAEALAKVQADMDRQRVEDQQQLQQQINDLGSIKNTAAYQARVAQDEEKKQQAAASAAAGEGYDIVQLGHSKV